MLVAGLIISIVNFLLFFLFFETVVMSKVLCFVFTVIVLVSSWFTISGYNKSCKTSKNSKKILSDRLKLFTAGILDSMVLVVVYHVFFNRRKELMALRYALPYVIPVMFFLWLVFFIIIRYKMKKCRERVKNCNFFFREAGVKKNPLTLVTGGVKSIL